MTLTWDEKKLGPQIDNLNIPESLNQNMPTFPWDCFKPNVKVWDRSASR